ncbi:TIGR01548 family HAD-type hydrolase [Microcoleus sp. FACHB-672]|uniref:TIGR01548 family HAD-type hydrolase n=1 Tax=Microcoleus sp. FACHB-672 TaxID=2692825 RepID=UPI003A5BDB6E
MDTELITEATPAPAIVVFDIDGVIRDVAGSYRRALADTVESFTGNAYRPMPVDIDRLKSEGIWNNDWLATQELVYRHFEGQGQPRGQINLNFDAIVAFFQSRYRGSDEAAWDGYICQETLLLHLGYLEQLTDGGIAWGFFSGAPRAEAAYVLEGRLGLKSPVLVAMEDAPDKPNPTGLFAAVEQLEHRHQIEKSQPVVYAGDTVADMQTIQKAQQLQPSRTWIGVGILPPHVQETPARCNTYTDTLKAAGAAIVLRNVEELTPKVIQELVMGHRA